MTGKNHGRHLCKECSKLDKDEIQFRQTLRNAERLIGWGGTIRNRNKRALEKFLNNKDKRISDYVKSAFDEDRKIRLQWKYEEEERQSDPLGNEDVPF